MRYRLTMSEVEAFSKNGFYEERTDFGAGQFRYAVKAAPGRAELSAIFEDNTITLMVPADTAAGWARSSRVGFSNDMALPDGQRLSLLLEKDFTCLDETGEDQSDNYPNPKAAP